MKKYKFFIDFDKEEKWLNDMAKSGYMLVSRNAFGGYSFRKGEPKDAPLRIDYRVFNNNADFLDYRQLFEDSGWRHISGTKASGNQYFARVDSRADDDIFSDTSSKAGRYKRLSEMNLLIFFLFLPLMFVLVNTGTIDMGAMLNPKLLYYTPGLWEKAGPDFWLSFLFETPFAFMRGFLWLVFPVTMALFLYYVIRASILQKKQFRTKQTS